jgi:hypothetical protein
LETASYINESFPDRAGGHGGESRDGKATRQGYRRFFFHQLGCFRAHSRHAASRPSGERP